MQSNTPNTESAKIEIARGWIAGAPLQRETAIRFVEALAENNPPAASALRKYRAFLAGALVGIKGAFEHSMELLDLFLSLIEGANESLAQRLGIEQIEYASNAGELPALPKDFPAERAQFVRSLPIHMQADLIDTIHSTPKREEFPLRYLLPETAHEDLVAFVLGMEPSTTPEKFVGECTNPFMLMMAAQAAEVCDDMIWDVSDMTERMEAPEACGYIREKLGALIVTNICSLSA